MKLKGKNIVFGLTSPYYAFRNTVDEMKNIVLEGGKIIPIIHIDSYEINRKYGEFSDFKKEIEEISGRKIITCIGEAEREEGDIMIIAPCSR